MRLIDADDLKAKIMIDAPGFMERGSSITKAFIMAMLESQAATPTIDAVPVVRCKYCKYYNSLMGHCKDGRSYPSPEWFCADGLRREEDG